MKLESKTHDQPSIKDMVTIGETILDMIELDEIPVNQNLTEKDIKKIVQRIIDK